MQKQMKLKIYGKVQGVFFRRHTQSKARELGLTGWASNAPDGTVDVLAEGEEERLKELAVWCKDGPEHARVERVEPRWQKSIGEFSDFVIR
jgi:acylphosphatase